MKKVKIVSYFVTIKALRKHHAPNLRLGSFDGGTSALAVVQAQLSKHANFSTLRMLQKAFRIDLQPPTPGAIRGVIWVGDYGFSGDIIDTATGQVTYTKKAEEAGPEPFYFHLALPDNETRGILCLQQLGNVGAKSILDNSMLLKFNAAFPDYRMHVKNLSLADELEEHLKNGAIEEVTAEKHEIPADVADQLSGKKVVREGIISFSVRPKDHGFFKRSGLLAYARGEAPIADVIGVGDIEFDEVTAVARVGNTTKKLILSRPDRLGMSFDISDQVVTGPDGYPTVDSVRQQVDAIMVELAKRGGIVL